ncbi:hypothetical protein Tco_0242922 [Tanacetum coccineum]
MINGDAGVKNSIFIPTGEKIWRSNWIPEKRKKDPYNISEERFTYIKYEIQNPDASSGSIFKAEMIITSVEIMIVRAVHRRNPHDKIPSYTQEEMD